MLVTLAYHVTSGDIRMCADARDNPPIINAGVTTYVTGRTCHLGTGGLHDTIGTSRVRIQVQRLGLLIGAPQIGHAIQRTLYACTLLPASLNEQQMERNLIRVDVSTDFNTPPPQKKRTKVHEIKFCARRLLLRVDEQARPKARLCYSHPSLQNVAKGGELFPA
jgi:hypothetical protein